MAADDMRPIALSYDAYATVRALQIHERMRATLITVLVQRELIALGLAIQDEGSLIITALGKTVPRINHAA
jgi:hypothetical protein